MIDELQAVRDLFTEPAPPRPEIITSVRAHLTGRPSGRQPAHRQVRLRIAVPAIAVTAAAAVITAAAVQAPPAAAPQAGPGASPAARTILLTAARTVAGAAVPPEGRFWQVKNVVVNFIRVGPAGRPYLIAEKVASQQWSARKAPGQTASFSQALSARPASARDRALWRLDGSPTTWHAGQRDSLAEPQGLTSGFGGKTITSGRGPLLGMWGGPAGTAKTFVFGHTLLSARELQALPASPVRLKALILRGSTAGVPSYLFQVTPSLLTMPVTPAVRAALYRMLADVPGVHSLGPVPDPAGQTGPAVALTGHFRPCGEYTKPAGAGQRPGAGGGQGRRPRRAIFRPSFLFASCTVQQRLIIDPHTGLPLAQELRYLSLPAGQTWSVPGGLFSYQLFGSARWTNAKLP